MTPHTDAYTWQGRDLMDRDGEKIGSIREIYEDERTGRPEWALVASGLFGARSHFVPLAGASELEDHIRVNVTKDQVKDAPSIDSNGQLSDTEEAGLFEHYGVPYTREGSTTAHGTPGPQETLARTSAPPAPTGR